MDHDRSTTQELWPTHSLISVTELFCTPQIWSLLPFLFLLSACQGATNRIRLWMQSHIAVEGQFKDSCLNNSKPGDDGQTFAL